MVLGLGVMALALLVSASDSQEKKDKAKGQLPPGWKDLTGLTAAQKEKIYQIQTDYKMKIGEMQKKIKDLQAEERKEMVSVLTDAQKEELRSKAIGEDTKKKKDEKKPADK
jgi:Spy/CpxP family protein refolding chaperone